MREKNFEWSERGRYMRRVLYMGQKPIGEKCFKILIDNQNVNYKVVGLVSNQSCEKVWWHSNDIYRYGLKNGLPFIDNEHPNEDKVIELIRKEKVNFVISVGHNWILSEEILEIVKYESVNLHLAKLPEYKGNYTYNHAILNNEGEYGVTLHWMDKMVDRGDYIFAEQFKITDEDTALSLYEKSNKIGQKLFEKLIICIKEDMNIPRNPMEGEGKFYSRGSLQGLREISNLYDTDEIQRKSRAFYFPPFESAYVMISGKKFYIIPSDKN